MITPLASAQSLADQAKELELRHKGKLLRVRHLLSDSKIRFDAKGNLVGKWQPGRWTWHSTVEVTGVEVKEGLLKIKANRLLLNYSRGTHKFNSLRSGSVEIEIETLPEADGTIDLNKEWNKAFLTSAEEYPLDMQPYWRPFIKCVLNPKNEECDYYEKKSWEPDVYNVKPGPGPSWTPTYTDVYTIGGDVKPPRVRSKVEPLYTDVARSAKLEGTVLLEAIVTKTGSIEIVRIIRPLGYGIEENAAEALSQWIFHPAMRMGQPVNVLLNIEVHFNLR